MPACNNKLKEKLALKLNSLNDIKARYESQKFLNKTSQRKSYTVRIIYLRRAIYWELRQRIYEIWHERLQAFSLTLMLDVINFCDRTNENVSEGIEKTKRELNQKLNDNEREGIIVALQKNNEVKKKHPEQHKRKKFNYLKYKPKTQNAFEINESSDQPERPTNEYTNEYQKPLYSSVLKRKSNTNLRRKFSKLKLAYNDNNNIKQTVLNARRNRRTSRNRTSEISQQTTEAKEKEACQNEITSLKKEIKDLKKERSTKSQIATNRQEMTSLTSKPAPQKNTNNDSKNEEGVPRRTGDPQ